MIKLNATDCGNILDDAQAVTFPSGCIEQTNVLIIRPKTFRKLIEITGIIRIQITIWSTDAGENNIHNIYDTLVKSGLIYGADTARKKKTR